MCMFKYCHNYDNYFLVGSIVSHSSHTRVVQKVLSLIGFLGLIPGIF